MDPASYAVTGEYVDDHGGWSYTTVISRAATELRLTALTAETIAVAWVPVDELERVPLHPGLAATWETVRALTGAGRIRTWELWSSSKGSTGRASGR